MNIYMSKSQKAFLCLNSEDNVIVALRNIQKGECLMDGKVVVKQDILQGHKIIIQNANKGDLIIKFGQSIGMLSQNVKSGEHIHTHNLSMRGGQTNYEYSTDVKTIKEASGKRFFDGYLRPNGKVGTRNYIGIITTVNCSGSVAKFIADQVVKNGVLNGYDNIDGIVPLVHGTGCGMSTNGEGYETLFRTITGYTQHANFGAILLIGLGCEVMQLSDLIGDQKITTDGNLRYMTIQSLGGTRKTVDRGVEIIAELAELANTVCRSSQPISHLCIGMQCGGSDGHSGITANPVLGMASDKLISYGATTILSETSEIYGAEQLLTKRAETIEVGRQLIERVRWWEDYCTRNGGEMNNNPSPGNKRGGLTTILEKSLGAVAKSGSAPLSGVYKYAEPIDKKGLVFMDSPGYDPASVTGQTASGANMIVFTTGRGSVSGYKPAPCIKLATNSAMYKRLAEDMDLNCGDIISDGTSMLDKSLELFELIIDVASGKQSKSEKLGFGGCEFVPWQIGAVM